MAAVLYTWNLSGSSLNSFYSAAVYSGTKSWKAWFFGSLDAQNFITVDKPPFALMIMGLSCRVFGFGTWQMMLPEVLAALGSITILHTSVKRSFGHVAATIAALVLALTPITVAINRDNNPDTILSLLMVSGAALALRATRDGKLLPLLGSAACFGLAFNTKMLQGWIALPAVFAVHLIASRLGWAKKAAHLGVAAVVLVVSSFWWATAVSLVPASERPYIGGSDDGSAWNLIMGYNGLGRILGGDGNGGGGGQTGGGGGMGGGFSGTAGLGRLFNDTLGGQISWLIPFAALSLVAGLVLYRRAPRTDIARAALILWGGWSVLHYVTFALAEGTMHPYYTTALAPGLAALTGAGCVLLWRAFRSGDARWSWVLPAGILVTAGWAIVLLRRATGWNTWLWPVVGVLAVLAVVGLYVFRSGGRARLLGASVVAALVASLAGPTAYAVSPAFGSSGGGMGGGMGGVNPTAGPSTGGFGGGFGGRGGLPGGSASAEGRANGEFPGGGEMPSGGQMPGGGEMPGGGMPSDGEMPSGGFGGGNGEMPGGGQMPNGGEMPNGGFGGAKGGEMPGGGKLPGGGFGGGPGGTADTKLISYLKKHQDGAKWLIAVSDSQSAGQMILSSGQPVISMFGFIGTDKAMTLDKLKDLVKKGELHYVQVGGGMGGFGGMGGGDNLSQQVTQWVEKHGTKVKESAYGGKASKSSSTSSSSTSSSKSAAQQNQSAVYRLDPSDVG
ncbi:glycosyltransferase family 39 protein [Streptomyces sp. NPDC004549]|uniref:ArnT family glycosyltransferase n=1 Tax=Streptomyces sp. NPDC004549 TaxID=3154283 RepID=UPI0033A86DFF